MAKPSGPGDPIDSNNFVQGGLRSRPQWSLPGHVADESAVPAATIARPASVRQGFQALRRLLWTPAPHFGHTLARPATLCYPGGAGRAVLAVRSPPLSLICWSQCWRPAPLKLVPVFAMAGPETLSLPTFWSPDAERGPGSGRGTPWGCPRAAGQGHPSPRWYPVPLPKPNPTRPQSPRPCQPTTVGGLPRRRRWLDLSSSSPRRDPCTLRRQTW